MEIYYHDVTTPCGHPADAVISALQKFIRRGQAEQAARAAYELYLCGEELTEYLWKRLLVISAEDVGLGAPDATGVVLSLRRAGRDLDRDCSDYPVFFVQAVRYLCACRKERGSSLLSSVVKRRIRRGDGFPLPEYVFDMHTAQGQSQGRDADHFFQRGACVFPSAHTTGESRRQENLWQAELAALMKEDP